MSNISILKIGTDSYDIKDSTARSNIQTLESRDIYATTEQLIGTYKGANLYRKVIDISSTSISSGSTTVKGLLNENINIINYSGTIVFATSNYTYSINGFRTLDYGLRYDRTNHALQLIVGTSLAPEGSFSGQVIIEYTKN